MKKLLPVFAVFACVSSAQATELCVTAWNLESTESELATLTETIKKHADCDVFVLSEVENDEVVYALEKAIEEETNRTMYFALSGSGWSAKADFDGGPDALAFIYDMEKLDLLQTLDLFYMTQRTVYLNRSKSFMKYRAPMVATFHDRETGQNFDVVGVHLARPPFNETQSAQLVEWAKANPRPVIAAGDFNYDMRFKADGELGARQPGYGVLTYGGAYQWAKPETLARTTCNTPGVTDYKPAVLDFIFTANGAKNWGYKSEVLDTEDGPDCADDLKRSDHRPIRTVFTR